MGSGPSSQKVIESKWWEAKAQHMLTTANVDKVGAICSLIPFADEEIIVGLLMARSDLDTLVALHCKRQNLPREQSGDLSKLNDDSKAQELWRVLRSPSGQSGPWDWNWQPPLSGKPHKIADEFHAAVSRAVFQVPFSDFVKCALGYDKAYFVNSLFDAAFLVRGRLRSILQNRPDIKSIYIEVEKILKSRYHPLAHWIVDNSLSDASYPQLIALASITNPINNLFAKRNLDFVLNQLLVLNQRLIHINQKYNWVKWSTDFKFLECVYQALWTENPAVLSVPLQLPLEDLEEKLCFLKGFETAPKDEVRSISSKVLSFVKKLGRVRRRSAARRPATR